jgi:hypothetical protein
MAEQDCFGAWGQADTYLKFEDLMSNKTLVNFHKFSISCAAECPDDIFVDNIA